jgi:pSer/pThr/pTyr-binding forkhead associated (FHA) protein
MPDGASELPDPVTESVADVAARFDAAKRGSAFLVYRDAEGRQRILGLETRPHTVGREHGLDISLTWDTEVSRVHAEIQPLGSHWLVVDDGLSRNGTWLNGARVSGRQRLNDGDTLRFGNTLVAFSCASPDDEARSRTRTASELKQAVNISPSQRRVLVALCRPYKGSTRYVTPPTNQQIADELFLSADAVKTHLRVLFSRFGLEGLAQNQKRARLAEMALSLGIVSDQEL